MHTERSENRYRSLNCQLDYPMATITLARPGEANRVDTEMAEELRRVCQMIRENEEVQLVVLTGSGPAFSVGREKPPRKVAIGPPDQRMEWLSRLQIASAIAALEVPVIVAVNGDALDHGLELALAGDLRIAAGHAQFGLTDLSQGSFPWDGGTQRLSRLVGPGWARDMILTSRIINASQALALGLVNRVVDGSQLDTETRALADTIVAAGPIAARYAKEAVAKGTDMTLNQGLGLEADLNVILQSTADRTEGIKSFLEKRAPRFTGR